MRRRHSLGATYWDLVDSFFEAQRSYHGVYLRYEEMVHRHAEEQAVDRRHLRLEAAEVSKLLDFGKLGDLRSGPLQRTLEVSHALFRTKERTHKFDRYLSEIFHDLSILREEQYKVSTFAEEYRRENEMGQYESILDEVHEDFPRRVHNIWALFIRAQQTLERALRARRRDPIYLRSLFLFGGEVFRDVVLYRQGQVSHCWQVFEGGPAEANLLAARSFAQAGFKERALRAAADSIAAAEAGPQGTCSKELLERHKVEAQAFLALVERHPAAELVRMRLADEAAPPGEDASGEVRVERRRPEPVDDVEIEAEIA